MLETLGRFLTRHAIALGIFLVIAFSASAIILGNTNYSVGQDPPGNENADFRSPVNVDGFAQSEFSSGEEIIVRNSFSTFAPPNLNFVGLGYTGSMPPNPVGDAGPNHYVQMVNDPDFGEGGEYKIFDKNGNLLQGPTAITSLFAGIGNRCETLSTGEPIVVYDHLADRWLLTHKAPLGATPRLCVAVSQTPDPAGAYHLYSFRTIGFNDFPHFGVWDDFYLVTYLMDNSGPDPRIMALPRAKMLNGDPVGEFEYVERLIPTLSGFTFQTLIPADLDGPAPPSGAPGIYMRHRDDEVHNPGSNNPTQDFLDLFELLPDFNNDANTVFNGPISVPISEFDSNLCVPYTSQCIPQPGSTTLLDTIHQVLADRVQYRNFGTHEVLVGNFTVDVDNTDHAGIRWFELRKTGAGPWALHQEGTYAPDSDHRWFGGISMDEMGNIALGYSVSSATTFPSIRYTGRFSTDPLGQMTMGEHTIVNGKASQDKPVGDGGNRWGDYSSMTVDPADNCTFWYTNEFIPKNNNSNWRTKVATFHFPNCDGTGTNQMVGLSSHLPDNQSKVKYRIVIDGPAGLRVEGADPVTSKPFFLGLQQRKPTNVMSREAVNYTGAGGCGVPIASWDTDASSAIDMPNFENGILIVGPAKNGNTDILTKLTAIGGGSISAFVMQGTSNCEER